MIARQEGGFRLEGPVTLANVKQLLAQGSTLFADGSVRVDLSGVSEVDSTALSLLLEWVREAERGNRSLVFLNLPENLLSLARVYGVLDLIPREGQG